MIAKIFWAVVALDGVAAVVSWQLYKTGGHGQGEGLLIVAYLIILAFILIPAIAFLLLRSDAWRVATFILVLLPSIPLLFWTATASINRFQQDSQFSGSAYFQGPALALAQAMAQHDTVSAKELIPAAGDLNQPHGRGVTLWQFAVLQAEETDNSIDLLRTLIAAGADPRRDTSPDALSSATARGPKLTRFLLEAGASPNVLDNEHRPVWWQTMKQGEDDPDTELLRMMLDHGADLSLRAPNGRGPVLQAAAQGYWYDACLLIERGAEWKQDQLRGWPLPQMLEWEIVRRDEYPIPVPEKMRKVLSDSKGEHATIPAPRIRAEGDVKIPDLVHQFTFDKLEQTRAAVSRLAQQPDWVHRVVAFFEEGDGTWRNQVALILSLKPEALPEDVQERCWTVLREQVEWYDHTVAAYPKERKGYLLRETGVIAIGLASIPGPARERHKADFTSLRDRIEKCRKENDPDASKLADLNKMGWR